MNTISILTVVINFLIMIFTAFTAYQSIRIHKDNHDFNRRKAAQEALSTIRNRVPKLEILQTKMDHIDSNIEIPIDKINEIIQDNYEIKSILHAYLNYYDYLSSGIRHGVFDEKIIKEARGNTMIREYRRFNAYILNRRKTISENAWSDFEIMKNRWGNEKTNKTDRIKI